MHRLTVSLARMVPPTRRQVEVWSDLTLAGLHEVIQVLFDWDGDHLYEFVVGRRRYADPSWLDACEDDDVPLAEVAGRAGKVITYTYDLGACWEHRIVVDAVEPAGAGTRYPRCVAGVGPHPAEYDGDRPRRLDLDALDQQLAELPLQRKAPALAPAQAAATPQVRALAADARQAWLLQDLVRLARWTATPRAVTATGVLKRPEVAGALQALRLPAPPAGFHSAKHLPHLDVCWRLAEDLDLIDISSKDAIPGPALAALDDDSQTLQLWTRLWELAAVDGRVLIYEGRAIGHRWVTPPLLWALWRAQAPMSAAALDPLPRPDHDHVGFVAWVLDQLVAVGGVERLGEGRYQLTPLGRHGHLAVLDHDPRGGHGGEPMTDTAGFTVADLRSRAGEEAFRAAGEHVVAIDGPDEDEWSLSATIRLDDGRTLETILHHRVGGPLDGECDCPQALAGSFCSHLVLVGLAHLGVDAPAAAALAAETAPAGDLRPWLATLSQRELIELVIEAAEEDRDYRRRLGLRSRTQAAQR